jgi:glycosyltransferase involved in cell wall biosynthesis
MKILHLIDTSLPQWRTEKCAISAKKNGHSVYFGGPINSKHQSIFDKTYEIKWTPAARHKFPHKWNAVKKQMKRIIAEVRPDVIHAHNIFSAKMAMEIGDYPLVYNDHEFWSIYVKRQLEAYNISKSANNDKSFYLRRILRNFARDFLKKRWVRIWSNAERDLVTRFPTITVSQSIVEAHNKISKRNFLVPNFPLYEEIEFIDEPTYHESLSSVYAGVEAKGLIRPTHRNLEGFFETFEKHNLGKLYVLGWNGPSTNNIIYRGYLNREEMYKEMANHSIGLVPFKKHWSHKYISPNKAYEYAHAGLLVMNTSALRPISETMEGYGLSYENNEGLKDVLRYLSHNVEELYAKRLKLYKHARNMLLWERYEKNIFEAYKMC